MTITTQTPLAPQMSRQRHELSVDTCADRLASGSYADTKTVVLLGL